MTISVSGVGRRVSPVEHRSDGLVGQLVHEVREHVVAAAVREGLVDRALHLQVGGGAAEVGEGRAELSQRRQRGVGVVRCAGVDAADHDRPGAVQLLWDRRVRWDAP